MPGTGTPDSISLRPATPAWHNFGWKALAALLILLLLTAGIPISSALVWTWVWGTLLVWGGLVVAIAAYNLLGAPGNLRWAWVALAVGAYAALSMPGILNQDPSRLAEALGPVVALTLVAHLGRRDLSQALRDWAMIIGLALYVTLGVTSMALVITSLGTSVFVPAVLLPPVLLEGALTLLNKANMRGMWAQLTAIVVATVLPVIVLSLTQLGNSTPLFVTLTFALVAGLLVGGALLLSLLTKPMIEAASGAYNGSYMRMKLARALVELTHGSILISLALYIPLRLLTGAMG